MIFILSNQNDITTTRVCEWLAHYGVSWSRLNEEDVIENIAFEFSNDHISLDIQVKGRWIDLAQTTAFWYRRGEFNFAHFISGISKVDCLLKEDRKLIENFLYNFFNSKPSMGNIFKEIYCDRLTQTIAAIKVGLTVPYNLVTTQKSKVQLFNQIHKNTITKNFYGAVNFEYDKVSYSSLGTKNLDIEKIESAATRIEPSLVQNYIEKKYELRIFFLGGQFYSVAIFSQQDEKTKLDFRNYNDERPNRIVSYKLPESVEVKLKNLVCLIKMDSGSIDLIVTKENDYIFLEINHVGQFLWTSDSCNLNFDEKVAIHLINLSKNKL